MIVTIDVGLKNLAMCIMSAETANNLETYKIHLLDVYNTLEPEPSVCKGLLKSGELCGNKAMYKYAQPTLVGDTETHYTCKKHFPKDINITERNKLKTKKVDDFLLQDITLIVILKLREIFEQNKELFTQVTKVFIELQPKINAKMKLVSHIIYGEFVRYYHDNKKGTMVRFVRAATKLRAYTGPVIECKLKGAYAKRKWLSIQYTKWILKNKFNTSESQKWLPIIETHTKADDLCDCFCYAVNVLHGIPKTKDKKGKCIK